MGRVEEDMGEGLGEEGQSGGGKGKGGGGSSISVHQDHILIFPPSLSLLLQNECPPPPARQESVHPLLAWLEQ